MNNHHLADTLMTILPLVLFFGILYWFLRRQQKSPLIQRQQAYLERSVQHMERIEQLLERLAVAVERKGPQA